MAKLITYPREHMAFFYRIETEGRVAEYLEALKELPESSVRDARIAQVLIRNRQVEEAKKLVYKHNKCWLAKAIYFSLTLKNADEKTMRHLVDNFRPMASPGNRSVNVEAQCINHQTLAFASFSLGRIKQANDHLFDAMQLARTLSDGSLQRVITYELAQHRMWQGQFRDAKTTYEQVLYMAKPGMTIHNHCLEYLSWIAWLTGETSEHLPDWARNLLQASRHQVALPDAGAPPSSGVAWVLGVMQDLRTLTRQFHLKLPVLYVQKHRDEVHGLAERIITEAGDDVGDFVGFCGQAMKALALSMQHQRDAIQVLRSSFRAPITGVPLMGMLYFANLVQVHANLPHTDMDQQEVRRALQTLSTQFDHLSEHQSMWLQQWMRDFTPVTLYLLAKKWNLTGLHDYVVVKPQGAYRLDSSVVGYPALFTSRHIKGLLAGGRIPTGGRMQAWRHVDALEAIGAPLVIWDPIIREFDALL